MSRYARVVATLAVGLMATATLSACGGDGKASGAAGNTIKIMVSAPLSGDSAETGRDLVDGAKFAADYLNNKGGVAKGELQGAKFAIAASDDAQSTEGATTIASHFVEDTDAFALMGYLSSAQAQAAGSVAKRAGLGVFSTYSCADFLYKTADNIVIMCTDNSNIGRAAVDFAVSEYGAKTIATIAGDYSFLDSYYAGIEAEAKKLGIQQVSKQTYPAGTSDFSPMLTNLKRDHADVILAGGFQTEAGRIVSQARRAGLDDKFVDFLGEGWGSPFQQVAGDAAIGAVGQYAGEVYEGKGFAAEIADSYRKQFGRQMTGAALHAFDTVLTINAAIGAGATKREDLIKYVPKATGEGTVGPIQFDGELRPVARTGVFAAITGPEPTDRKVLASYHLGVDGVERTDKRIDK